MTLDLGNREPYRIESVLSDWLSRYDCTCWMSASWTLQSTYKVSLVCYCRYTELDSMQANSIWRLDLGPQRSYSTALVWQTGLGTREKVVLSFRVQRRFTHMMRCQVDDVWRSKEEGIQSGIQSYVLSSCLPNDTSQHQLARTKAALSTSTRFDLNTGDRDFRWADGERLVGGFVRGWTGKAELHEGPNGPVEDFGQFDSAGRCCGACIQGPRRPRMDYD